MFLQKEQLALLLPSLYTYCGTIRNYKGTKMKFVTVRDLRLKPGEIWKRLEMERELIITSNGKPMALLTGINEDTMESTLTILRRTRAILAMEEMQRTSVQLGLDKLSDEEIEAEVKAVRDRRQ